MVFWWETAVRREKGIAGSSNMADGSHVVGGGKPQTVRGSTGSDVMTNRKCNGKQNSVPGPEWSAAHPMDLVQSPNGGP